MASERGIIVQGFWSWPNCPRLLIMAELSTEGAELSNLLIMAELSTASSEGAELSNASDHGRIVHGLLWGGRIVQGFWSWPNCPRPALRGPNSPRLLIMAELSTASSEGAELSKASGQGRIVHGFSLGLTPEGMTGSVAIRCSSSTLVADIKHSLAVERRTRDRKNAASLVRQERREMFLFSVVNFLCRLIFLFSSWYNLLNIPHLPRTKAPPPPPTHTHTHGRTHARTHTHTHARTHARTMLNGRAGGRLHAHTLDPNKSEWADYDVQT